MKLVVEVLRSGNKIVRPEGSLGTCGFYPKAWEVVYTEGEPIIDFLLGNPNWQRHEITGVEYDRG